jgi:hypothetical protein
MFGIAIKACVILNNIVYLKKKKKMRGPKVVFAQNLLFEV